MKKIIFFLLLNATSIYSQDLLKNINWRESDNSELYRELQISSADALVLKISIDGSLSEAYSTRYIVFDKDVVKHEYKYYKYFNADDYHTITRIRKSQQSLYNDLLKKIASEDEFNKIAQSDLEFKKAPGFYNCTEDGAVFNIEIYQGSKSLILHAYDPEEPCGRDAAKINLFLKLFREIEYTFNLK